MKSVGTQLREARQKLGWTLKSASKTTKIREDQLQRMETDDFEKFHAPTYVRGFVRNYATALGLNVRELMEDLESVLEMEGESSYLRAGGINYVPELTKSKREITPRSVFLGLAILLLLLFVAILGIHMYRVASSINIQFSDTSPKSTAPNASVGATKTKPGEGSGTDLSQGGKEVIPPKAEVAEPEPRKAKPGTPDTASVDSTAPVLPNRAGENHLSLSVTEACWVRISVMENSQPKIVFEDILTPGKNQDFPSASKYIVKLGIPAAVEISLNGKAYPNTHSTERTPVEFSVPAVDSN